MPTAVAATGSPDRCARVTATYGYDVLNRLTQVRYGGGAPEIHYSNDQSSAACGAGETFNQAG